jgi:V8-like Glu-specific endopeptidase
MPKLTAEQRRKLHAALVQAFESYDDLAEVTDLYLNERLANISSPAKMPTVVLRLITWGEARGILDRVIEAARNARPENPELTAAAEAIVAPGGPTLASPAVTSTLAPFAQQVENASAAELRAQVSAPPANADRLAAREALQRKVLESVLLFGAAEWRARMAAREATVCRVEFPTHQGQGTGFLVGPDLVITNHHVLSDFIDDGWDASQICCRFDYQTAADGVKANAGRSVALAAKWLVRYSPTTALDYAIVRLAEPVGNEPLDGRPAGTSRGWLSPAAQALVAGESIFVLQHPKAAPLKVASGGLVKAEARRVYYLANTLNGSSGSPCFSANWELVALHRAGDELANVGVPFAAIVADVPDADRPALFPGGGM